MTAAASCGAAFLTAISQFKGELYLFAKTDNLWLCQCCKRRDDLHMTVRALSYQLACLREKGVRAIEERRAGVHAYCYQQFLWLSNQKCSRNQKQISTNDLAGARPACMHKTKLMERGTIMGSDPLECSPLLSRRSLPKVNVQAPKGAPLFSQASYAV